MTDTWTRVRFVIEPSLIGSGFVCGPAAAAQERLRVQPGEYRPRGPSRPTPRRRPDGAGGPRSARHSGVVRRGILGNGGAVRLEYASSNSITAV